MFFGQYTHAIDVKGRLSLPQKYREIIKDKSEGKVIITKEFDPCLVAYTLDEWSVLRDKIRALPSMSLETKNFKRIFFGSMTECSIDKQGRVLISQVLRDYAGLEGETYWVGNDERIEIWQPGRWQEAENKAHDSAAAVQAQLSQLGI